MARVLVFSPAQGSGNVLSDRAQIRAVMEQIRREIPDQEIGNIMAIARRELREVRESAVRNPGVEVASSKSGIGDFAWQSKSIRVTWRMYDAVHRDAVRFAEMNSEHVGHVSEIRIGYDRFELTEPSIRVEHVVERAFSMTIRADYKLWNSIGSGADVNRMLVKIVDEIARSLRQLNGKIAHPMEAHPANTG